MLADLVRLRNPLSRYRQQGGRMASFTDTIDWLGGWPFEVAKNEQIFDFYTQCSIILRTLRTCAGRDGFLSTR
jgi:2-polyprenyl-6-hydroxyphenyl methylase/3-demethylubiquinone-9 3-methyltransferase